MRLSRDEGGLWSFERLLPTPPDEEVEALPFVVNVSKTRVYLSDRSVGPVGDWVGDFEKIRVEGVGENWTLYLSGFIEDAGRLVASASYLDGVLKDATIDTPSFQLGRVRRYLDASPEFRESEWLKDWSIVSGQFSGVVNIAFDEQVRLDARGVATASSLVLFGRSVHRARFDGYATERGMSGDFEAVATGAMANATGSIGWADGFAIRLSGSAWADSDAAVRRLVSEPMLPADLRFSRARFEGDVEYGRRVAVAGNLVAASVSLSDYTASDVASNFVTDGTTLLFTNTTGNLYGSAATGDFALVLTEEPTIRGSLSASGISLDRVPNLPRVYVLGGRVNVNALIEGPLADVSATVNLEGTADLLLEDDQESVVETVDVRSRAAFSDGRFDFKIVELAGPSGSVRASGFFGLHDESLDFKFEAFSVSLGLFPSSPASGTVFAQGSIKGSLQKPIAEADAEVYDAFINGYSLPFSAASLRVADDTLFARGIDIRAGVGQLTGEIELSLVSGGLLSGRGLVNDASVLYYFPNSRIYGLASGSWSASGTLGDPIVRAELSATNALIDLITANSLGARFEWRAGAVHLEELTAMVGDGKFSASGTVALHGESVIAFSGANLPAESLRSYIGPNTSMTGTIDLTGALTFLDAVPTSGQVSIRAEDIELDGVPVGSGDLEVTLEDTRILVNGAIGSLDGFIVAEDASVDWSTKDISGSISMLRFSTVPLYRAFSDELLDLAPPALREMIAETEASVTAIAHFGGTLEEWRTAIALTVSDIKFRSLDLGVLDVSADRQDGKWTIERASLEGGPVRFALNKDRDNFIEELGDLQLDGEFSRIDLDWLPNLWPELAGIRGVVQVPFLVFGKTSSPDIIASVNGRDLAFDQYSVDAFAIDRISISDGEIVADGGQLGVRGLEARLIEARVPFRYPFEVPDGESIFALIDVPSRDLNALSRFFGGLDTEETRGTFTGGSLTVSGTKAEWRVDGTLSANAERLKFNGMDTVLVVPSAELRLQSGHIIGLDVSGSTVNGGEFFVRGGYDVIADAFTSETELNLTALPISQRFGDGNVLRAVVSTTGVNVSGSLLTPTIGSDHAVISIDNASLVLDGDVPSGEGTGVLPIDPNFAIRAIRINNGSFRSGVLRAEVDATGFLLGSLSNPLADMLFTIQSGAISLPTHRIGIEQGGVAHFKYGADFTGQTLPTLQVDFDATTRATAFNGLNIQRYTINLNVSGDVLSRDELRIEANSDPPDLSRDQIFAILGQRQLFESIGGAISGNFEAQLRDILSLAAPNILAPLTQGIERSFGLDYVFIDFSQGASGVVTLGKSIGNGFTLEYRRPIDESPRTRAIELIQIIYRPPLRGSLLNRLNLAFGIDGEGLWRASLGYSGRF